MADQASAQQDTQQPDRRANISRTGIIGVIATVVYLLFVFFVLLEGSLCSLLDLELNEMGDFLAGSLGPLGLFWLILGFFQQGAELRNSIKALKLQTNELKQSVEAQRELADATGQQLKLQQEEFALTAQELTKARHPKFVVSYLGKDADSKTAWRIQEKLPIDLELGIANVGGTACEVELKVEQGHLKPDNKPVVVWPQFETQERQIELHPHHGADETRIDIHYRNADGDMFTASYRLVRTFRGDAPNFEIQPCDPCVSLIVQ